MPAPAAGARGAFGRGLYGSELCKAGRPPGWLLLF